MPWRREGLPTPVFWPGEFHGLYPPLYPIPQCKVEDADLWLLYLSKCDAVCPFPWCRCCILVNDVPLVVLCFRKQRTGNSLVVQWLGLYASNAEGPGLIPGWETNLQAMQEKKALSSRAPAVPRAQ